MAIVQTVNLHKFYQAFIDAGRKDQFSDKGLEILFDYLEELSDDIGEPIELDVIALCCGYSEDYYKDIAYYYDIDLSEADGDECEELKIMLEYMENNTSVCGADANNGIIVYAQF